MIQIFVVSSILMSQWAHWRDLHRSVLAKSSGQILTLPYSDWLNGSVEPVDCSEAYPVSGPSSMKFNGSVGPVVRPIWSLGPVVSSIRSLCPVVSGLTYVTRPSSVVYQVIKPSSMSSKVYQVSRPSSV